MSEYMRWMDTRLGNGIQRRRVDEGSIVWDVPDTGVFPRVADDGSKQDEGVGVV